MKRAVLYARVSGDDRRNESRNLQGQLDMCREYAEAHGYAVVAELAEDDRGASGAAFELPKLSEIRRLSEVREFDILVVREIDRLSRNLAKQLIVEEELTRAGVHIDYVLGEYPDDPEGRLSKHIKATIAEYEREKIRERMMRGRQLKVKAGNVHVHGRPPFGYRLTQENGKETLQIVENEAAVVRQIFAWYSVGDEKQGSYSLREIRKLLNERQIPTPADRGKPGAKKLGWAEWSVSSVAYILNCETYAGVWRYGKTGQTHNWRHWADQQPESELSVAVPNIVDRPTWNTVRQRLLDNRQEQAGNVQWPYLLRKRLRCGHCGSVVASYYRGRGNAPYGYYQCAPAAGKGGYNNRDCCALSVNAAAADEVVWGWLKSLLLDKELLLQGLRGIQSSENDILQPVRDRLAVVERDLADNQAQLGRLLDLYLSDKLPRSLLDERSARLQGQTQALTNERTVLQSRLQTQAVTDERIANAQEFAAAIAERLPEKDDFEFRRLIVETLDVRGELTTTPDQRILSMRCLLGQKKLGTPSRSTHTVARPGPCRLVRPG